MQIEYFKNFFYIYFNEILFIDARMESYKLSEIKFSVVVIHIVSWLGCCNYSQFAFIENLQVKVTFISFHILLLFGFRST